MTKLKNIDCELSSPTRTKDTFPIVGNGQKKPLYFFLATVMCVVLAVVFLVGMVVVVVMVVMMVSF